MSTQFTSDIDDLFFQLLPDVCRDVECEPRHMLGVMNSESGVHSASMNPTSSATGLIQWMADSNGRYCGKFTRDEFAKLLPSQQLLWAQQYFRPYRGKLINQAAVYLAVFLPAQIGLAVDSNAVVAAKAGPYGWAWRANTWFDFNSDAAITVSELEMSIKLACAGPRWNEIAQRAGFNEYVSEPKMYDLGSVYSVQRALSRLGFDPGAVDGLMGPKTISAIKIFQAANKLDADGIVGQRTLRALVAAMTIAGVKP